MSISVQRLKHISLPTKDLINGYIRNVQNELFGDIANDNPYYNIPQLINNHCILFYESFTWYKEHHGDGLKFISDTQVTVETRKGGKWLTCMFENVISNKFCKKFSITFKIKSFGKPSETDPQFNIYPDFYIGYTKQPTLEESILNWNDQLGEYRNAATTCSWGIYSAQLCHSGDGDAFDRVKTMKYSVGDLLKMVLDFDQQKAKIYHNNIEQDSRDFKVTTLWVGVSLNYLYETVEMVEYKYE